MGREAQLAAQLCKRFSLIKPFPSLCMQYNVCNTTSEDQLCNACNVRNTMHAIQAMTENSTKKTNSKQIILFDTPRTASMN